ncbi:restriction endonuclease subunit S, partial [Acinetobacter sp.]|uniref:restriction endonuclease subunit S n=1 Tax=Acinetobacter sp. TaxID=472 RepID=UPI003752FAAB
TIAKPGSIAISTRAPIGHIAITSKESCVNQGCRLIEPIGGSTSFWYYCANASVNILQSKGQGTTFMELPRSSLASTKFPVPPVEEQQKIAEFLDYKTAQIYALIAKKEDLLLKLQEKRSALITQAVTKGINPGAPMKPSGVEWLGAVPAYWNIKRLKFTVNLISDKIEAESSDLEYMGLEHIESWTGKRIEDEKAFSEGTASKFLKDDVLFGKLRPYLAKVYLANHTGLVSTEALVLRSKKVVYGGFLRYYMATRDFIDIVNSSTFGSKMPRANWDFIGNLPMLLPEYDEQVSIANFIESKLSQLDAQKKKVEDVIAKLQEYRAALITNAVTGKIDVRDFTIRINQKACPG